MGPLMVVGDSLIQALNAEEAKYLNQYYSLAWFLHLSY